MRILTVSTRANHDRPNLSHLKWVRPEEVFAIVAVLLASAGASYIGSKFLVLNPDAVINVYVFNSSPFPHGLLALEWHTNFFKWPLAYLQGLLPFNTKTFTLTTFVLVSSTLLGWASVSAVALGRRLFAPICFILAILTAGSLDIVNQTGFMFIRNVEYPLLFLCIILFWKIVAQRLARTSHWWGLVAGYITLASLLMMSDPYSIYALVPALLIVLSYRVVVRSLTTLDGQVWGFILAIVPVLLSNLGLDALKFAHVFEYYGDPLNQRLHKFADIPLWTWNAIGDVLNLFNASPFGQRVHLGDLNSFGMFLLVLLSLTAFYIWAKRLKHHMVYDPVIATLIVTAIVVFVIYIGISGFEHQERFLVLPVLILCTSLAAWIQPLVTRLSARHILHLSIVLTLGTVCLLPLSYHEAHVLPQSLSSAVNDQARLNAILGDVQAHRVDTVVSSYTYTSLLQFAAHGQLHIVPLLFCNQNFPFSTLLGWYHVDASTSSQVALIVDREGRDAGSWLCSLQNILHYYGTPLSKSTVTGLSGADVQIYYYPSSIIQKVHIIKTPGGPKPTLDY